MANMSYCRFHNTASDMKDCLDAMGEAIEQGMTIEQFRESLSEDESYALSRVLSLAESMMEVVEEFSYNSVCEEEEEVA